MLTGEKESVIFYCISDENGKKEEMAGQVRIEFDGAGELFWGALGLHPP